jgi:hypothetical protein
VYLNPHLMERPDSPDWSFDLTEFRKAVFGTLLKRAGSHLARLWSAELAECSESSQTAPWPWITCQLQDRSSETLGSYRDCPREMTDSRSNFSGQFR